MIKYVPASDRLFIKKTQSVIAFETFCLLKILDNFSREFNLSVLVYISVMAVEMIFKAK